MRETLCEEQSVQQPMHTAGNDMEAEDSAEFAEGGELILGRRGGLCSSVL